jgi:chromosome segregation ATPase
MSFSSERETKEGTVEEKKDTIATTAIKPEEPKRRVRRGRRERREGEQTMEVAKEKPTTAVVPTIPKRLLNRIDKHDAYLANIQRDVRLINRELKKLTTRVNRIEARLVSLRARAKAKAKKGVGSSKKKKGRSK